MSDVVATDSVELIKEAIEEKGQITFKEFMALALYSPNGYYQNDEIIFGAQGDFITAPDISPLFGQMIAKQLIEVIQNLEGDITLMELGPGTGKLAKQILTHLKAQNINIEKYILIETSRSLTKQQQQSLKDFDKCHWYQSIPDESFNGVILANELFDALPVHRVQINETLKEWYVTLDEEQFTFKLGPISQPALQQKVDEILTEIPEPLPLPYDTEFNLEQEKILSECNSALNKGVMLFIDYGFSQNEYYHPTRYMGTLMGHHKHLAHLSAIANPGKQDITAHVDFTALTKCAHALGFDLLGFTTQAHFLLGLDILKVVKDLSPEQSNALQTLLAPHEMGELFKVIAFEKDFDSDLSGFSLRDLGHTL